MAYKVLDIAKKLIKMADWDTANGGEGMTNLRLQKLLYYEQGYHLAVFDTPLFNEVVEAWMYGPVVPVAYDFYQQYGSQVLPVEDKVICMSDDEEELFAQVFEAYREFSAIGLMNKTHQELPWASKEERGRGVEISQNSMKVFFKTQLIDDKEN